MSPTLTVGLCPACSREPDMSRFRLKVWRLQKREWQNCPGAVIVADFKLPDDSAKELVNWQKGGGFSFPVIAIVNNLNGADLLEVLSDGGAVNVIQRAAIDKQLVETVCKYAKPENIVLQLGNSLILRSSKAFRKISSLSKEWRLLMLSCPLT